MVTDAGSEVTKEISRTGSTLDEQFGVTETKNGVTTDDGGKWVSTEIVKNLNQKNLLLRKQV